jgi:hypothetical protein
VYSLDRREPGQAAQGTTVIALAFRCPEPTTLLWQCWASWPNSFADGATKASRMELSLSCFQMNVPRGTFIILFNHCELSRLPGAGVGGHFERAGQDILAREQKVKRLKQD